MLLKVVSEMPSVGKDFRAAILEEMEGGLRKNTGRKEYPSDEKESITSSELTEEHLEVNVAAAYHC